MGSRTDSLENGAGAGIALRNIEVFGIHVVVILCVGNGRLQQLLKILAGGFRGILHDCQRNVNRLVAYEIENNLYFSWVNTGDLSCALASIVFLSFQPLI